MTRTANSGSTSGSQAFALKGIVTVAVTRNTVVAPVEYSAGRTHHGSVHIDDFRVSQSAAIESPASR
ncbi:hypothetical protein [Nonomuraea zeae]|uniref:Uncharacterized protein n=1 Tax=Nonomuraea zeae TaxID=1642303 RepID=A0A5S4GLX0_9ACTN|nr:hypothetical protein [Nonomuraea zeae]TMR33883.1 hypothetical protein ETD85_18565 [Nonomuraea zeae]